MFPEIFRDILPGLFDKPKDKVVEPLNYIDWSEALRYMAEGGYGESLAA